MEFDPEREITVCCGATEGMVATLLAVLDPGDEVVLFEPFYENYGPDTQLCGATSRYVTLHAPDWSFDPGRTARAPSRRAPRPSFSTRRIIPPARCSTREELEYIAGLCQEFDCLAITDEIYEHILYDGAVHIPIMSLPGMRERSILVNSMSKTYSVTGWRVGWVLAPPDLTDSIRKVHDFLTVGAAAPLAAGRSDGAFTAGRLLRPPLDGVRRAPRPHRHELCRKRGFQCFLPHGAYYVMTDISAFGFADDAAFVRHLIDQCGSGGRSRVELFCTNGWRYPICSLLFLQKI